jgi:hypothetical protein
MIEYARACERFVKASEEEEEKRRERCRREVALALSILVRQKRLEALRRNMRETEARMDRDRARFRENAFSSLSSSS